MVRAILVLVVLIFVGMAVATQYGNKDSNAASNQPQAAATEQADPTDILRNKKFLAANPKYVSAIRQLIVASGFECPAVSGLWLRGMSPYGNKLEALCGPNNKSGSSYVALHYAVYPDRLKVNLCKEFSVFSGDCS